MDATTTIGELARRAVPGTGEALPVLGLGTWKTFDTAAGDEPRGVLERFAAAGGAVVDSSPMYGRAEERVGEAVDAIGNRDRLFLATKIWTRGRDEGLRQLERSFRRLRARVVDLAQVHNLLDWRVHLDTLREWKAEGRIRYLGVTHYAAAAHGDLVRALEEARPDFVQVNYSLAEPEAAVTVLAAARDLGVAVLANRPFAEGDLFRRLRGRPVPEWARAEWGAGDWAALALRFCLAHPAVTCVLAATSDIPHLEANLAAARTPLPSPDTGDRLLAAFRALG